MSLHPLVSRPVLFSYLALLLSLLAFVEVASAQERSEQKGTENSLPKVLPLVVETTRRDPQGGEGSSAELYQKFWWGGEQTPLLTPTDNLLGTLSNRFVVPSDVSQISSLFKVPHLTLSNAAALAKTFGAKQVLLGTFQHNVYAEKPLGEPLQSFQFEGVLLDVSGERPHMLRELSFRRTFLGEGGEREQKEMTKVLSVVVDALARPVAEKAPNLFAAPVTTRLRLALKGMKKVADLQQVIHAIENRSDVGAASILWASDNVITLEVLPKEPSKNSKNAKILTRDGLLNFLMNSRFDGFQLDVTPGEDDFLIVGSRLPM